MADAVDSDEDPQRMWEILSGTAGSYRDERFRPLTERLVAVGPPPQSLRGAPLIIDTNVTSVDEVLALVIAARGVPELSLVITSRDGRGRQGQLIRWLLRQCGRPDVAVAHAEPQGPVDPDFVDALVPDTKLLPPVDMHSAVAKILGSATGTIRWLSLSSLGYLAAVIRRSAYPAGWFHLVQLTEDDVPALDSYRSDVWSRLAAARSMLPILVTPTVTDHPENELGSVAEQLRQSIAVTAIDSLQRLLDHTQRLEGAHFRAPLALAVSLELPFVDLAIAKLGADGATGGDGEAFVCTGARYSAFHTWLTARLSAPVESINPAGKPNGV